MKISNKLLLSALIIFIISLGIYNTALKAEYLTGNYKDPYKNFNTLSFKDFDEVRVNAATQTDVTISNGPAMVRLAKRAQDRVKITQKGKTLIIDVVYNSDSHVGNELLISCPQLKAVKAYGIYTENSKRVVQNNDKYRPYYNMANGVLIQGFKQDSLSIEQDNFINVTLKNNTLQSLKTLVGLTVGATPSLTIDKTNKIQAADLKVNQKAQLELNNIYIPQLVHQFGDSTKVSYSGAALKSLKN